MTAIHLPVSPQSIAKTQSQENTTLTIDRTPVSFRQILRQMRSTGKLPEFLQEILSQTVIEQELQQRTDLEIDALTVQKTIDHFRQHNNLQDDRSFHEWLLQQGWDEAIFDQQVKFDLKLNRFKAQLAEPKLLEAFINQKLLLDQVVLSRIVVSNRDLAEELKIQIVEDGMSFEQLAQDYSKTDDAVTNGMVGMVSRSEAQSWFGIDLYQVQAKEMIGPIALEQDWCLLRVEKILPAELTDAVKEFLQEQIFQQWLSGEIQAKTVNLYLSDD